MKVRAPLGLKSLCALALGLSAENRLCENVIEVQEDEIAASLKAGLNTATDPEILAGTRVDRSVIVDGGRAPTGLSGCSGEAAELARQPKTDSTFVSKRALASARKY